MNNIRHVWTVVCQKSIIDSTANTLSIIDVLEKIDVNLPENTNNEVKNPIAIPFNLEVISFWRRTSDDKNLDENVKMILYSPEGKELASIPMAIKVPDNAKFFRAIVKMNALPLTKSGEYKFEILQKKNVEHITVAEIPFDVIINKNNMANKV